MPLQRHSRENVLSKKNIVVAMAEATSQPETAISAPVVARKDTRKQIILTDDLRQHIGDILAVDLESDEPQFPKVLALPRTRGRS